MDSEQVSRKTKSNLTDEYLSLNPALLKRKINEKIKNIKNSVKLQS